ncbi:MAG: 4-amino-4-deoxy-L-arabinose transferase-like glycosyltransferase [Candidatus Promineifilaceae bacterium]|jgi:4-amino-4-deoxy-L-arabinose transferase-like glycosyltransferase
MKRIQAQILISLIVLLAFALRYWTIDYDLPYIFHPDEPLPVAIAQRMLKTGDLNPHFYHWPPLLIYLHLITYLPFFLIGRLLGDFQTVHDILPPLQVAMGTTWSPMPTTVLMGRMISLLAGSGTVLCVYVSTNRLFKNHASALLAAGMMAIAPTSVHLDRFIAPDSLATFFIVVVFVFAVGVYQKGDWKHYIWAGLFTGFAAASKYNAGLILPVVVLAHFLRTDWKDWFSPKLISFGVISFAGFALANPYAILDYPALLEGLSFNAVHYATGHAGMEGDTFRWYLNFLTKTIGLIWLLAIATFVGGFFTSLRKEILLTAAFPVYYFLFIMRFIVRNDRTVMPLTPFLFMLAAVGLISLLTYIRQKTLNTQWSNLTQVGWVLLFIGVFYIPAQMTLTQTNRRRVVDSRTTAREWIDDNLPEGSNIALESYSPFASVEKFSTDGYPRMIDQSPNWYVDQGYDYLIFGEGMYGRFYFEPERYPAEIEQYAAFFDQFEEVQTFNDGDYEVKIYKISQ